MIALSNPVLKGNERAWMLKCLDSGFVSSVGPLVNDFERAFAKRVGTRYAVATASGTAALHVALRALGIGPGDRVIVPDLTFVASMNPVFYAGAEPLLADVDRESWCLSAELVRGICTSLARNKSKIRAIIPVHLYGCCCDMNALTAVAQEFDLRIVEDATEALGVTFRGRAVGSFGDLGCFSFNGNKIITTGSGGMVVTDSRALAEKVRYLVNQARDSADRYVHSQMGYNYRMDSLSAALGLAQLEQLDDFVQAKRRIAARYRAAFAGLDCLTPHPIQDGVVSNFWLYSVVAAHREQKERWLKGLNRAGIMARGFFLPLHGQPYVRSGLWCFGKKGATMARKGNSDYLSARGINLPSSSDLTEDDQNTVVSNFLKLTDQP